MPIKVDWGNEAQTLVVMRVHEPYTPEELVSGVEAINAMMEIVDHRVCPAVDFSGIRTLPTGALANYRRIGSKMGHPNSTGQLVVIGAHRLIKPLLEVFSKVFRKIEYADTVEEALALVTMPDEVVPIG